MIISTPLNSNFLYIYCPLTSKFDALWVHNYLLSITCLSFAISHFALLKVSGETKTLSPPPRLKKYLLHIQLTIKLLSERYRVKSTNCCSIQKVRIFHTQHFTCIVYQIRNAACIKIILYCNINERNSKINQPLFKMCFFYLVDIDVEIDYMKMSDGTSPPPKKKIHIIPPIERKAYNWCT